MSELASRRSVHDKLSEARYFLDRMEATETQDAFRDNLSAFVSAARSVTEIMRKSFQHLDGFKDWFQNEVEPRMAPGTDMAFVNEKRRLTNHTEALRLDARDQEIPRIPFSSDPDLGEFLRRRRLRQFEAERRNPYLRRHTRTGSHLPGQPPPTEYVTRWYFPEIQDRDAFTVCTAHYANVKAILDEFEARFGR